MVLRLPLGHEVTYKPDLQRLMPPTTTRFASPSQTLSGFWMAKTIYVLNGPNLDLLGNREPEIYGHATLSDVETLCGETAERFGLRVDCRQSSDEAELVDFIHEARARQAAGIVINAGGHSFSSVALHDALVAAAVPAVEVHISNIHARENFRQHACTAKATLASLSGFGIDGYRLAISGLAAKLAVQAAA
jgi:3-dehydroquinate dehydratase II